MNRREMNCHELDVLLDTHGLETLTPAQKQAVDGHFAACSECRAAWAAYEELAALEVPATRSALRPRIAAALAAALATGARARTQTMRRSLAIGGVVVFGAAAAATLAIQWGVPVPGERESMPAPRTTEPMPVPHETEPMEESVVAAAQPAAVEQNPQPVLPQAAEDAALLDAPRAQPPAASSTGTHALDPLSIVVIALPDPATGARAAAFFAECHEQVVEALSAIGALNVIAGEHVSPYVSAGLRAEEIARQLGAGSALVLRTADQASLDRIISARAELGLASPNLASCLADQLDAQTGAARVDGFGRVDPEWGADTARAVAQRVAEHVREATLEDTAALIAAAQAAVLDTRRSDRERVLALERLRQGPQFAQPHSPSLGDGTTHRSERPILMIRQLREPVPEAFDEAVVAAAAQLGLTSPDAHARQVAWNGLRGVRRPDAIQALLSALAYDADENVRRAAALALGYVADEPGVREALLRAAAEDSSALAPVPCCVPSVREAARRALLSDEELRASALRTVLDETLSSEDRIRPLHQSIDGRDFPLELNDDAARAVFEIGSSAEDAALRSRAWDGLVSFRNPDFMPTLLDDLRGHPADTVRASAATALALYAGEPSVRDALEHAETDSSLSVRRAALAALGGSAD